MNLRIPIYIEEQRPQAIAVQHVRPVSLRPLFFPKPIEQDTSLQRATAYSGADCGDMTRQLLEPGKDLVPKCGYPEENNERNASEE